MQAESPTVIYHHALRVYWKGTDPGGVVLCANSLKFFERARSEWLRTPGFSQQQMPRDDGVMFVVADGELRAEGEIRIGCVAAQGTPSTGFRPGRIPAALLEKIQ